LQYTAPTFECASDFVKDNVKEKNELHTKFAYTTLYRIIYLQQNSLCSDMNFCVIFNTQVRPFDIIFSNPLSTRIEFYNFN
jgi:hypothetical protein